MSHQRQNLSSKANPPPWAHFIAGAAGGISATIATAPLDIVKTRLQSTLYADSPRASQRNVPSTHHGLAVYIRPATKHLQETLSIIAAIKRKEGTLALFRGLGPNLAGYVPATALKFLFYGNAKAALVTLNGQESAWTHLLAGNMAGILTCTVTNPFWVIKTRLQLDDPSVKSDMTHSRHYKNSVDCVKQTLRQEGIKGLYRGLGASYIGTVETALHWVIYEQLKTKSRAEGQARMAERQNASFAQSMNNAFAAGASKLVAAISLYPHEVLRTRLRETPKPGTPSIQIGLWQCLQTIIAKEGVTALYGGLSAHLLRVVPSSAVVFAVYEAVLQLIPDGASTY